MTKMNREKALKRVLWGTMIGDSLGLPAEGISKKTLQKLQWNDNWRHRLIFGKGMLSDDSEHCFMLATALIESNFDKTTFQKIFARKLKFWLLGLPAGIGFGTLRSLIKLWMFFPPTKSGVNSAGNGPAMRSALLGVVFADDKSERQLFTKLSTEITHRDKRALVGASAISECAALFYNDAKPSIEEFISTLNSCGDDNEWQKLIKEIENSLQNNDSVETFANKIGCSKGVGGYVYHTVPVACFAAMRHYGGFRTSLQSVLNLGGDTDTVGAICGALAALTDEHSLPEEWCRNICEWPRSPKKYDALADDLHKLLNKQAAAYKWHFFAPFLLIRNIPFILLVLTHGFLRLLPKRLLKLLLP
ncbi:MAG: ADP-ribosylglycohydrolase family protein [Lentisphaeraceae bacterium]|nr:ADP-ribosylglycohydrolase family protein [Lentisphaeraceae bacterium]